MSEQTTKVVEVWLYKSSEPLVFSAISTYQKGDMFCVYDAIDHKVRKFPIMHIFRVVEDYITHGGGGKVHDWRLENDQDIG